MPTGSSSPDTEHHHPIIQKPGKCPCGNTGACLFCDGKGHVKIEEAQNMIFDEEHGWIVDPDDERGAVVKHVTKTCHMCEGGKCHYCTGKKA